MITSPKSSPSVEEVIPPLVLFECSERIMRGLTPTRPLRPQLSLFHTLGEFFYPPLPLLARESVLQIFPAAPFLLRPGHMRTHVQGDLCVIALCTNSA